MSMGIYSDVTAKYETTNPATIPPLELTSKDTVFLSEIAGNCEPINEHSVRILVLVGRRVRKEHERLTLLSDQRKKSHEAELVALRETHEGSLELLKVQHADEVGNLKRQLFNSHKSIFEIEIQFTASQKRKLQRAGLARLYDFTKKTWDEIKQLLGTRKADLIGQVLILRGLQFKKCR